MISLVSYDEGSPTGLVWNVKRSRGIRVGDFAGSKDAYGYWRISLNGKRYKAHRVIMALHGLLDLNSELQVDHINHDKSDNRLSNLRVVTAHQNSLNLPDYVTNTSGHKGVYFTNRGKWQVSIRVNKKYRPLRLL